MANFGQEEMMQKTLKKKRLKHWHMGTHLRVLSESNPMNTNMTGFPIVFKNLCFLVLWTNAAAALEGLTFPILRLLSSKAQERSCLKTV